MAIVNQGQLAMDFTRIDKLGGKLKSMRPLNATEIKRLRDEFDMVENTDDNHGKVCHDTF